MHSTIDYSKYNDSEPEKIKAAVKDIKEYLDERQWDALVDIVSQPDLNLKQLLFAFMITGIQGYPTRAFVKAYIPERYEEFTKLQEEV